MVGSHCHTVSGYQSHRGRHRETKQEFRVSVMVPCSQLSSSECRVGGQGNKPWEIQSLTVSMACSAGSSLKPASAGHSGSILRLAAKRSCSRQAHWAALVQASESKSWEFWKRPPRGSWAVNWAAAPDQFPP